MNITYIIKVYYRRTFAFSSHTTRNTEEHVETPIHKVDGKHLTIFPLSFFLDYRSLIFCMRFCRENKITGSDNLDAAPDALLQHGPVELASYVFHLVISLCLQKEKIQLIGRKV